jgi:hypothetical protein
MKPISEKIQIAPKDTASVRGIRINLSFFATSIFFVLFLASSADENSVDGSRMFLIYTLRFLWFLYTFFYY